MHARDLDAPPQSDRPPRKLWSATRAAAPPVLGYGRVLEAEQLTVLLADGARHARRAKSCLVAPAPGDRVLCSIDDDVLYVLAVLESSADPSTHIAVDGPLSIEAEGDMSLRSQTLNVRAKSGRVAVEELSLFGRWIDASFADKATLLADRVESRASRIVQRAKQAFRFVSELEQARVGNYDLRAESLAAIRGENTIMSARVLAKLDGEQVKIG